MKQNFVLSAGLAHLVVDAPAENANTFPADSIDSWIEVSTCPDETNPYRNSQPHGDWLLLTAGISDDGNAQGGIMLRQGEAGILARVDFEAGLVETRNDFCHVLLLGTARIHGNRSGHPYWLEAGEVFVVVGPSPTADARILFSSDGPLGNSEHDCALIER